MDRYLSYLANIDHDHCSTYSQFISFISPKIGGNILSQDWILFQTGFLTHNSLSTNPIQWVYIVFFNKWWKWMDKNQWFHGSVPMVFFVSSISPMKPMGPPPLARWYSPRCCRWSRSMSFQRPIPSVVWIAIAVRRWVNNVCMYIYNL